MFGKLQVVVRQKQLRLPSLKVFRVEKKKSIPQPQVGSYKNIRRYEILHRPFDLQFRGRIHKWLAWLANTGKRPIIAETGLLSLYFYPQPPNNRWLNQDEVLSLTELRSKRELRKELKSTLLQIWNEQKK